MERSTMTNHYFLSVELELVFRLLIRGKFIYSFIAHNSRVDLLKKFNVTVRKKYVAMAL